MTFFIYTFSAFLAMFSE